MMFVKFVLKEKQNRKCENTAVKLFYKQWCNHLLKIKERKKKKKECKTSICGKIKESSKRWGMNG